MKDIIILITAVLYVSIIPLSIMYLVWVKTLHNIAEMKPSTAFVTGMFYKGSKVLYLIEYHHDNTRKYCYIDKRFGTFNMNDLVHIYIKPNKHKNDESRVITLRYTMVKMLSYLYRIILLMILCNILYGVVLFS